MRSEFVRRNGDFGKTNVVVNVQSDMNPRFLHRLYDDSAKKLEILRYNMVSEGATYMNLPESKRKEYVEDHPLPARVTKKAGFIGAAVTPYRSETELAADFPVKYSKYASIYRTYASKPIYQNPYAFGVLDMNRNSYEIILRSSIRYQGLAQRIRSPSDILVPSVAQLIIPLSDQQAITDFRALCQNFQANESIAPIPVPPPIPAPYTGPQAVEGGEEGEIAGQVGLAIQTVELTAKYGQDAERLLRLIAKFKTEIEKINVKMAASQDLNHSYLNGSMGQGAISALKDLYGKYIHFGERMTAAREPQTQAPYYVTGAIVNEESVAEVNGLDPELIAFVEEKRPKSGNEFIQMLVEEKRRRTNSIESAIKESEALLTISRQNIAEAEVELGYNIKGLEVLAGGLLYFGSGRERNILSSPGFNAFDYASRIATTGLENDADLQDAFEQVDFKISL